MIWAAAALLVFVFLAFHVRRAFRNGGVDVIGGRVSPMVTLFSAVIIAIAWGVALAVKLGFITDAAP